MNNNIDFSVAIAVLNRKIAELNIEIVKNKTQELSDELDKYLELKKELYNGNFSNINKIIDGEI